MNVRFLEAARNDLREAIRDQPRNPLKSTEKKKRTTGLGLFFGMVQAEVTAPGRQDRGWVAILDQ